MHPNSTLKHCNQYLVDCHNLVVGLWIVRIWDVVMQTQLINKLYHHIILKMRAMVSDDGLKDTKSSYDMIKKELSCSFTFEIICGHRLGPFSEIIDSDDDITMPSDWASITCHEINTPFGKGSNNNNWVQGFMWGTLFVVINLVRMTFLDYQNVIF